MKENLSNDNIIVSTAVECSNLDVSVTRRVIAHLPRDNEKPNSIKKTTAPPVTVEIHPTLFCNARCGFCYYSSEFSSKKMISSSTLLRIAGELSAANVKSVVISGGGEPTLHPNLSEFIDACLDGAMEVGLITNGFSIKPKLFAAIEKISWVKFSMHSSRRKNHAEIFNVKNALFDSVVNTIKNLTSLKNGPIVSIGYVVDPEKTRASELLDFMSFGAEALKVNYVLYKPLMEAVGLFGEDKLNEFISVEHEIKIIAKKHTMFTNYSAFIRDATANREYTDGQCPVTSENLICFIDGHGDLYPCLPLGQSKRVKSDNLIGNLNELSFSELWNGKKHREWIENMNMSKCPICKYEKMFIYVEQARDGISSQMQIPNDPHINFL